MLKSIRNIIIIILIMAILSIIPYWLLKDSSNQQGDLEKKTTIIIDENGIINVTDEITFKAEKSRKCFIVVPRIFLYKNTENEFAYRDTNVYQNGMILDRTDCVLSTSDVRITNIITEKGLVYKFKINYQYNTSDVVKEYNNISVLNLYERKNISKSNIKIQLPKKVDTFKLNPNAEVEYLGNNQYNIKGILKDAETKLLIDKGIIKNAQIIDEVYEVKNIRNNILLEDQNIQTIIIVLGAITGMVMLVTLNLTRKTKFQNEYVRNTKEVIEPILAEAIVDGRIGVKELIMCCLVDLIRRGNLQNIGNEKIQLLNYEKTSKYEKEILGLIFEKEGQIVEFDKVKEIFIKNNKETKKIYDRFKRIRKNIEEELFKNNIYSKIGQKFLNVIKILSTAMILNCLYIWPIGIVTLESIGINEFFKVIMINLFISMIINKISIECLIYMFKVPFLRVLFYVTIIFMIPLIILLDYKFIIMFLFYEQIHITLVVALIIILNIITLKRANTHIFTKYGKNELKKAIGLKKYIIDYSLMKERELDSVIIWDEYLAYAVAFGIPNKITEKFNENLMNVNMTLQKIESIFNVM